MSKESREFQANVKFDETTYRDLEECSELDFKRGVAGIIRKLVAKFLPTLKRELLAERAAAVTAAKAPPQRKFDDPGRSKLPKGTRGISKRTESLPGSRAS